MIAAVDGDGGGGRAVSPKRQHHPQQCGEVGFAFTWGGERNAGLTQPVPASITSRSVTLTESP